MYSLRIILGVRVHEFPVLYSTETVIYRGQTDFELII